MRAKPAEAQELARGRTAVSQTWLAAELEGLASASWMPPYPWLGPATSLFSPSKKCGFILRKRIFHQKASGHQIGVLEVLETCRSVLKRTAASVRQAAQQTNFHNMKSWHVPSNSARPNTRAELHIFSFERRWKGGEGIFTRFDIFGLYPYSSRSREDADPATPKGAEAASSKNKSCYVFVSAAKARDTP